MKHTITSNVLPLRALLCLTLISLLLSACALPQIKLPGKTGAAVQEGGMVAADAASAVTPVASDAPQPTDTAAKAAAEPVAGEITTAESLSGLVLFTSLASDPFASTGPGKIDPKNARRYLWMISPDGQRSGRLSPEGYDSALVPVSKPEGKILVMANSLELTGDAVMTTLPPEACQEGGTAPCTGFDFGLQGRTYAYFSGESSCGKTMHLVERASGSTLASWENVSWFFFNQDGGLIISISDCSTSYVYQYIPNTGIQSGMAADGEVAWDPSRNAALIQVSGAAPVLSALWGFNLTTSRPILWHEQGKVMQDSPVWLEDGRHFVYQHRAVRFDKTSGNAYLDGPRQIILMDAWTRAQHLLAFNGNFDFHLCPTEGQPCTQAYGEWLKITRTPFQSVGLKLGTPDDIARARCQLYGLDCMKPGDEFALNWKTGEIIPWADASISGPQPAPSVPSADQSLPPIYADPDSIFSLYTSADGHALWYVPASGDPLLLVSEGEDFVYVP